MDKDNSSYLHHEALHATHMVESMFEEFVLHSVYVKGQPDIAEAAEKVSDALGALYQLLGAKA